MAAEFEVTWDVIQHISGVTTEHMRALNQELTSAYRDHPDAAFSVALGAALGIALHSFSRPEGNVVPAINGVLATFEQPWRLVPVSS
jgi:hypothetical protein